jgi:hypothetical protein
MKLAYKIASAFLLMAGTAQATPWDRPAPTEMKDAHIQYAESANRAHGKLNDRDFGLPPNEIDWDEDYVMLGYPLPNLSVPALSKLMTGRYFIFTNAADKSWSVRYHSDNGKTYFCETFKGKYQEWVLDRYVTPSSVGLGGIRYWNPNGDNPARPPEDDNWGWPIVANPDTGEIGRYYLRGDEWKLELGWFQDEFPSVASVHCPRLPRASKENTRQSGKTLMDLAKTAKPVRGFTASFKNNPRSPLTAGMYYHLYPPAN